MIVEAVYAGVLVAFLPTDEMVPAVVRATPGRVVRGAWAGRPVHSDRATDAPVQFVFGLVDERNPLFRPGRGTGG